MLSITNETIYWLYLFQQIMQSSGIPLKSAFNSTGRKGGPHVTDDGIIYRNIYRVSELLIFTVIKSLNQNPIQVIWLWLKF